MKKIALLYVSAGHGHQRVAEAVADEMRVRSGERVQIELIDALGMANPLFRFAYPQTYFQLVKWAPRLWGYFFHLTNLPLLYAVIKPCRSLWNRLQAGRLLQFLAREQFDLIICTHFLPAQLSAQARKKGSIRGKLVVVVTDVIPHHVWQNDGTDFYWVMAEESKEVLVRRGVKSEHIIVGGIPVNSRYLETPERDHLLRQFGLHAHRKTLLFSSGSFGIGPTARVLAMLNDFCDQIQVLVVCGNNRRLFSELSTKHYRFPIVLLGFVDNMPDIMSISDLIIAKPGGATMCESLVKKLPMVIVSPIPGQETDNARWLLENEASLEIKKPLDIVSIMKEILNSNHRLTQLKSRIDSIAKPDAARDLASFALGAD